MKDKWLIEIRSEDCPYILKTRERSYCLHDGNFTSKCEYTKCPIELCRKHGRGYDAV